MYEPKWHHFYDCVVFILLGFAARQYVYIQSGYVTWDVFAFVQLPLGLVSMWRCAQLFDAAHHAYGNYYRTDPPKPQVYRNEPRVIADLNRPMYENAVTAVRFDAVRNCCNILLTMHEQGMAVNLTEEFWLDPITTRGGRKMKRWQGKNKEFQEWKKSEEGLMFGRESLNQNARYVVRDEARLRRAANGEKI